MNVLVLVGSNRPDSLNAALADIVAGALPTGTRVERFDGLESLPFYSAAAEQAAPTASVTALREAVASADAILIATPEYNASVPAVLKNAVDWTSRPREDAAIAGKPVAVVGASPSAGGTASAREHLVAILTRAGAAPLPQTLGIPSAFDAIVEGELIDPAHVDAVGALVNELTMSRLPTS